MAESSSCRNDFSFPLAHTHIPIFSFRQDESRASPGYEVGRKKGARRDRREQYSLQMDTNEVIGPDQSITTRLAFSPP